MSVTTLQTNQGDSGGYKQTSTIAFSNPVKLGSLLVIASATGIDTPTFTDSLGNTWNIASRATNVGNRQMTIAYVFNAKAGTTTITQTTTNFADAAFIIREYNGFGTTDPLDQTATSTGSNTSFTATSGTTTQGSELVVGAIATDSQSVTYTGDSNFTAIITQLSSSAQFTSGAFQDRQVNIIGTEAITIGTSNTRQGSIAVATFKTANNSAFLELL